MRKLPLILLICLLLGMTCAAGESAPEPTSTPAPTPVPDMIAVPDGTTRPIATATPRPTDAPLPADPFIANAVEIARRIDLLAESRLFMSEWDFSGATQEQIDAVAAGDHTNPARIFLLRGETLVETLTAGAPEGSAAIDLNRVEIRRDLVEALPDMLLSPLDEVERSLIATLSRYKVFAHSEAQSCGVLILLYADATPVLETWYADRGAVKIAAWFLPDDALADCATAEDVTAWFAGQGMPPAALEEVHWQ